jgi:membrane protease YdiL (CAAX protease family)
MTENKYSANIQIAILVLCLVFCYILASIISVLSIKLMGYDIENIDFSNPKLFIVQGVISQLGIFGLSLVMFIVLTKQKLTQSILFKKPEFKILAIVFGALILTLPIVAGLSYFNSFLKELIPNNYFILQEENLQAMQASLLSNKSPILLVAKIIVIAIFPAFLEEFIFRGLILKKIWDASNNKHYAVVTTAVLFALIHLQPTALLPMTFLAVVMGYFYTETKNIWYSVLFHFLFNLTSIMAGYFGA